MSNLLHQVSWSLLYIIGQREGRRGIFYSYNVTELAIYVDSIEDVSGICEMDSLKSLSVNEKSISDEAIDQLEDKGIKVTTKKSDDEN